MRTKSNALTPRYKRLMEKESWKDFSIGITLGILAGTLTGLALIILLPACVSLSGGHIVWGLRFDGWLITLAALSVVVAILDFFGQKIGYIGALGFMHDMHHKIGNKIAGLPLGWFQADSAGTLSRMVTQEMMNLAQSAATFIYQLFYTIASTIVIIIGSWIWSPHLGILLSVAIPILFFLLQFSRRFISKGKSMTDPHEDEVASRMVEFARCQGALRSCNASSGYPPLFRAFEEADIIGRRALWWEALGNGLSGSFVQMIVVGMIYLCVNLAISGQLGALETVATIGMCLRFTKMLEDITTNLAGMEERRILMDHVDEVMDTVEMQVPSKSKPYQEKGSLSMKNVSFSYEPAQPILRDISFDIPSGTMCALVGPSGCGKTTIVRLLSRFYDVDSGQVLIGGVDVKDLTTEDLMSQISMIFQDVYLFDDSLKANIKVGNPMATDAQIRAAADLAGVTEIANRLPDGWDSRVGEGGRSLSGGERQRVSIARALVKQAPIVLVDEATSALDAENEGNIVRAFEELRKHATLVVIAHKLETIQNADQVLVLNDRGQVIQTGSHEELIAQKGQYQDFWEYRNRAADWSLV